MLTKECLSSKELYAYAKQGIIPTIGGWVGTLTCWRHRRLARRGGVKRIQTAIYEDIREVIRKRLGEVAIHEAFERGKQEADWGTRFSSRLQKY